MLVERAYAKINLTLDVIGKRTDGYHEVDMVMQTIDLSDVIWIEEIQGTQIEVESSVSHIPLDRRNLAVMAAEVFRAHTGIHNGLRIRIDKQIPVAAGLAGGSSDAAAVLRGLNRLWSTRMTCDELAQLGASVGSDVPFCVHGGCAIARGRGEVLEPVDHHFRAWVVLVRPSAFVSTADVYGALRAEDYAVEVSSARMVGQLLKRNFEGVRDCVSNGMTNTTLRLYPEVAAVKERVESIARLPVFMSGSGPTLYCLLPTQPAAQRLYNALRGFLKDVHLSKFMIG